MSENRSIGARRRIVAGSGGCLVASALILSALLPCACNWEKDADGSPSYVALQELDSSQQPIAQSSGVLVAVTATGGSAVVLSVSGGTIDDAGPAACVTFTDNTTFVVTIHPTGTEAILTAMLGNVAVDASASPEAGDDASTLLDAGAATAGDSLMPSLCGDLPFASNGQTATVVVSLGRAPAPPVLDAAPPVDATPEDGSTPDDGDTEADSIVDGADAADASSILDAGEGGDSP